MKDFDRLIKECISEVRAVGIVPGEIEKWELNRRAKKRWGQCKKQSSGKFVIQIGAQLLEDERVSEEACKTTMIHEILHTCEGGMKHTGTWKEYARKMNETYGYNIKRTTSAEEKGLDPYVPKRQQAKYIFMCRYCGQVIARTRKCKFTRYYKNYSCGRCGRRWAFRKC